MKRSKHYLPPILFIGLFLLSVPDANGQLLKKLGKAAERAAERTVERRVEKETSEKTDQALDSIFEPGSSRKEKQVSKRPESTGDDPTIKNDPSSDQKSTSPNSSDPSDTSINVYSKFDFVPGDETLFLDDFLRDFVGDFPSKWNTNGSAELVTIDGFDEKWMKIMPGSNSYFIPNLTDLPEEFTLEFDVITQGLDNKTSSQAYLTILASDNNSFEKGANWASVSYSFCQYIDQGVLVENHINGKRVIRNEVQADLRKTVVNQHHISIAVNKQRFRFWIDEQKYIDVPRLLPETPGMAALKFNLRGTDSNKEAIYMSNFKIAKGGVDLRRKLLADGKISTNGILFDSGSANIQPRSMGVIRQIYQVLEQDSSLKLKIVGHTDSDGDANNNKNLSEKRAAAVKNALTSVYNVSADRLTTEGKGEAEPLEDNGTPEGKAQNRRVEFIRI
ncbi:MAG: hypothetical protein CML05_03200 [Pseudozobellia sp.]|nr:hypothetical protein [Pseudozobellia sp.]|tara:strand:+ start:3231 stop:4571 length:1341 start_codon:yes stop_codon:yes gene_type:complete